MRNEGGREGTERGREQARERERGDEETEKGKREQGESLFLLNSLTVVLSALPPALPQCQAAACINNAGDSTRGTGQTSNRHLPGNHHYGHHRHDNNCWAHMGVSPFPAGPAPLLQPSHSEGRRACCCWIRGKLNPQHGSGIGWGEKKLTDLDSEVNWMDRRFNLSRV